jgi:hypothetical protein
MTTTAALPARRLSDHVWTWYLVIAVCLAPVLVPPGPGRSAWLDPFNLLAMAAFAVSMAIAHRSIQVPFAAPVIMMSVGSLLATANAANAPAALFTLVQDAYLYVWFVMMVNLLSERGDLRLLRVAWVLTGCGVAVIGLVGMAQHGADSVAAVLNPKGFRAMGTFDQPDELADYLALSIFMALSLQGRFMWLLKWGSIALILLAMAATKANGGLLSLSAGLVAMAIVGAWTRGVSPEGWVAGGLLTVGSLLTVVWLIGGLGLGASQLSHLESHSFLGRMGHSSEGREKIWQTLVRHYQESPLGIGPGNSRWQTVTIEERERPINGHLVTYDSGADPFLSKEAHNDYIAYMVERGPLALLGMLILRWQVFLRLLKGWRSARAGVTGRAAFGALTAAMFGAWVCSCLNANTIETLHFRHVWLFLAMVCALELRPARQPGLESVRGRTLPSLSPAEMPS